MNMLIVVRYLIYLGVLIQTPFPTSRPAFAPA